MNFSNCNFLILLISEAYFESTTLRASDEILSSRACLAFLCVSCIEYSWCLHLYRPSLEHGSAPFLPAPFTAFRKAPVLTVMLLREPKGVI